MVSTLTAPVVAPVEPTTPIKPSEALRLGRLLRPRRLTDGNALDGEDGACAIAAIWVGGVPIGEEFGPLSPCPAGTRRWLFWTRPCVQYTCTLPAQSLVSHLNDDHKWSDDQIVAWLESLRL